MIVLVLYGVERIRSERERVVSYEFMETGFQ